MGSEMCIRDRAEEKDALGSLPDFWKTAPSGGEFTSSVSMEQMLVTDLEHMNQVSEEVKNYYREKLDSIDQEMNVAEYGCRELPYMDEAHREIIR